ncbi:MAG TPA: hypothetical protein PLS73_00045 [Saprospiraceae bacterium]|nr:hypothetical protein [Saprospiraceae bacterium]
MTPSLLIQKYKRESGLILLGSIVLMRLAFINSFPFVYPDTGTYIRSGFELIPPIDRPIFYGLLIRLLSFSTTLWNVVLFQSLMTAYLIYLIFRTFIYSKLFKFYYLFVLTILSITTGISFNASMLTPDIFTPCLFLSIFILGSVNEIHPGHKFILSLIFILSLLTHHSHVLIFVLSASIMYLLFHIYKYFRIQNYFKIIGLFVLSLVTTVLTNYSLTHKWTISQGAHAFLLNKLHENELLVPFLTKNCLGSPNYLCSLKDSLPWDLIWDSKSPVTNSGDWNLHKSEDERLIKAIIISPEFGSLFLLKSIQQSLKQFFKFNTGDAPSGDMTIPPLIEIRNNMPSERKEFLATLQINKQLDFRILNAIQAIVVYLSFCILLLPFVWKEFDWDIRLKQGILLLLIFASCNAFVCSTFSIVLDRYQSRIVWLFPLFASIVLFKIGSKYWTLLASRKFKQELSSLENGSE